MLHYWLHVAIFSWKFQNPTTLSFVVFQPTNLLFSFKKTIYFKDKIVSVSFVTCGYDILIISRCVSSIYSVIWLVNFVLKTEKNPTEVLKIKPSFKKMAIFAGEYLKKNKPFTCKISKCYFVFTILGEMETLETCKGSSVSNISECVTVPLIFILSLMFVNQNLRLN